MPKFIFFILAVGSLLVQSCTVSLINTGIDYDQLKSFSIEQFNVSAGNAPPTSGQTFSEQLKNRVLNNTRLSYADRNGDVQFTGNVSGYTITALAPQPDQTVAFQRLTIKIDVTYKNTKDKNESASWQQTFSRFADFSSDQDLSSVENALITDIYSQLLDDVFNRAFSGW